MTSTSVREAVEESTAHSTDAAAVSLALAYAKEIDAGASLESLGPKLLAVLESLGLTPKGRGLARMGGGGNEQPSNPLDELKARRAARAAGQRGAEAVDAAASAANS